MKIYRYIFALLILVSASPVLCASPPEFSSELIKVLGKQYERLTSGPKEIEILKKDLLKLANKNDPVAQFILAPLVAEENPGFAKKLLLKSNSKGCIGAAGLYASILLSEENYSEGVRWLEYAAEVGDSNAQVLLAMLYMKGHAGIEKDSIEGLAWLKLAESRTYSEALWMNIAMQLIDNKDLKDSHIRKKVNLRFSELSQKNQKTPYNVCGQSVPGFRNDRNFDTHDINNLHKLRSTN